MFDQCISLSSLPDVSKWNTSNITEMNYMFYGCYSLISLPDISKWNISKNIKIKNMFYECNSLISLPDISKWNINNDNNNINELFNNNLNCLIIPNKLLIE